MTMTTLVNPEHRARLLFETLIVLFLCGLFANAAVAADATLFDDAPPYSADHLYSCLFARHTASGEVLGINALDPLFWPGTTYLLEGDSHRRALACLDEFLSSHAERKINDAVRRAILQRDLWILFDWSAQSTGNAIHNQQQRRELQIRLAEVLRRLALTKDQLEHLPDTYAAALAAQRFPSEYDPANPTRAFLPPDLFHSGGPWVCLNSRSNSQPTAIVHLAQFYGHSRFFVFMHLPGGRQATFDFFHRLHSSREPIFLPGDRVPQLNPQLPQFPVGTELALVRQLILFDNQGELIATPITESVQIRVFHSITGGATAINFINGPSSRDQDFIEFHLDKRKLFANPTQALAPVATGETEYSTFLSHGIDMEGPREILKSCHSCHADAGIHSVISRNVLLPPNDEIRDPENADPQYGAIYWETENSLAWKSNRYDWGLLNGYWRAITPPAQKP